MLRIDPVSLAGTRRRSLTGVQLVFAAMAAVALVLSLAFHYGALGADLAEGDSAVIARAFLLLAAVDTLMVFAFERLWPQRA